MTAWHDATVVISGEAQSLVQSVDIQQDTGLDLVYLNGNFYDLNKDSNIVIGITYLTNGLCQHPTGYPFHNTTGLIEIYRKDTGRVKLSGCVLVGLEGQIDANSSYYGSCTVRYRTLGMEVDYTQTGLFVSTGNVTGVSPKTGGSKPLGRCGWLAAAGGHLSSRYSCNIEREYLHEQGRDKPSHIAIKYPIRTISTDTFLVASGTDLKDLKAKINCFSIPSGVSRDLKNVSLDRYEVRSPYTTVTYDYESTDDYGLQRIISLPTGS